MGEIPPKEGEKGSGSRNPLGRVWTLYEVTQHLALIEWLCKRAEGYFVANPPAEKSEEIDREFVAQTREMVRDFYKLLEVVSESYENDGLIDEEESQKIRAEWDKLKSTVECFVHSCEQGYYR